MQRATHLSTPLHRNSTARTVSCENIEGQQTSQQCWCFPWTLLKLFNGCFTMLLTVSVLRALLVTANCLKLQHGLLPFAWVICCPYCSSLVYILSWLSAALVIGICVAGVTINAGFLSPTATLLHLAANLSAIAYFYAGSLVAHHDVLTPIYIIRTFVYIYTYTSATIHPYRWEQISLHLLLPSQTGTAECIPTRTRWALPSMPSFTHA